MVDKENIIQILHQLCSLYNTLSPLLSEQEYLSANSFIEAGSYTGLPEEHDLKDLIRNLKHQIKILLAENKSLTNNFSKLEESHRKSITKLKFYQRNELNEFECRIHELKDENIQLQQRLQAMIDRDPTKHQIIADTKVLLEERQKLKEEIEELHLQLQSFTTEKDDQSTALLICFVMELSKQLESHSLKYQELKEELDLKIRDCNALKEDNIQLKLEIQSRFSQEEHSRGIGHCMQLYKELQWNYQNEKTSLESKMTAVKCRNEAMQEKLSSSSKKSQLLSSQILGLRSALRKYDREANNLSHSKKYIERRMKSMAEICSALIDDRKLLLDSLSNLKRKNAELHHSLAVKAAALGAVEAKLKEEKALLKDRMIQSESGRKALHSAWKHSSKEVTHLRSVIVAKEEAISSLLEDLKSLRYNCQAVANKALL